MIKQKRENDFDTLFADSNRKDMITQDLETLLFSKQKHKHKNKSLFDVIDQKYNEIMQKKILNDQLVNIKDLIKAEIRSKSEIFVNLLRNELMNLQMAETVVLSLYMRERDKKLRCDFLNINKIKEQIDYFVEHEGLLSLRNAIDYSQIQNNLDILKTFIENEISKVYKKNLNVFRNELAHLYSEINFTNSKSDNEEQADAYNHLSVKKQHKRPKSSLGSTLESPELPSTPEKRFRPFF